MITICSENYVGALIIPSVIWFYFVLVPKLKFGNKHICVMAETMIKVYTSSGG